MFIDVYVRTLGEEMLEFVFSFFGSGREFFVAVILCVTLGGGFYDVVVFVSFKWFFIGVLFVFFDD